MLLVAKCVSNSITLIELEILSADRIDNRIEKFPSINPIPGALYEFHIDNSDEYIGEKIETWSHFFDILTSIPDFQELKKECFDNFVNEVSLSGDNSLSRYVLERYGSELSLPSEEKDAISTISKLLYLLNENDGSTIIRTLDSYKTSNIESVYNAYCRVLSAVVKNNSVRVQDILNIECKILEEDKYEYLLSYIFEIIKGKDECLKEAIRIEPQIALEAKNKEERELCIKVCPKDKISELQYDNISEENFLLLNDEYLDDVIYHAKKTIEEIYQLTCTFDLEGDKESGKVYEYAFRFKEKNDGVKRSYNSKNQLVVLQSPNWEKFKNIVENVTIFAGHNFKYWDNDILLKNKIEISNENVWDTLEIEIILDGYQEGKRKNFALNVENGHYAENDVSTTETLFRQQLLKIVCSPNLFFYINTIIPKSAADRIQYFQTQFLKYESLGKRVIKKLYNEIEPKPCLYDIAESRALCSILSGKNKKSKKLIIADYSYWPQIAKEVPNIQFHYSDTLKYYNPIDCEKIIERFSSKNDVFHKYVFLRACKTISEKQYLRICDIPDVILKHRFKRNDKDSTLSTICNELKDFITDPKYKIHCACLGKAVELLRTEKYDAVYLIGSHYNSEDITLEPKNYQELKSYILSRNDYDVFVNKIEINSKDCKVETIKTYIPNYDDLFSYWAYQTQPGDFEIKRKISIIRLKEYCEEKKYELLSNNIEITPNNNISIIKNSESFKFSSTDTSEENSINFWRTQLDTILSLDLQNRIVIADNLSEANRLKKMLEIKCNVSFNPKESLYKRLDKIRDGKYEVGITYLEEIFAEAKENLKTSFSFILNDISLLLGTKDSLIASLYELYNRINEHSMGSKLILANPKPIDVIPQYEAKQVSCKNLFSEEEVNALKAILVGGNPISEDEVEFCESKETDKKGAPAKRKLGKMLSWIEEEILDNKYYPEKKLRPIQIAAIQRPIKNKSKNNNYLTIIPTGGGKSAIFQGPILYKSQTKQGYCKLNIVISPLQALMKDQIDSILGIPVLCTIALQFCSSIKQNSMEKQLKEEAQQCKQLISKYKNESNKHTLVQFIELLSSLVENLDSKGNESYADQIEKIRYYLNKYDSRKNIVAYINASTSKDEQYRIIKRIQEHQLTLLYIAPERMMIQSFFEGVICAASKDQGIDSVIFDEAHCITGWGMDFRPYYVLALRKVLQLQERHSGISIHMFTATLPEQCRIELQKEIALNDENIIPNIPKYENSNYVINSFWDREYYASLCPIRDHIAISAKRIPETDIQETSQASNAYFAEKIEYVFSSITTSKYININLLVPEPFYNNEDDDKDNSAPSRIIIFTYSRKDAEEGCELLKEKFLSIPEDNEATYTKVLANKIGFFHAGLSKNEKDEIIKKYRDGRILILFSTKAFGMGMDIPNIHHVIHLTPPTYIEDYLQEVGRAGRNIDSYEAVFPIDKDGNRKTIEAICLYSLNDIKRNKDRICRVSWALVTHAYKQILQYLMEGKRKIDPKRYYAIPMDLLERYPLPSDANVKEHNDLKDSFQQCLNWLSRQTKNNEGIQSFGLNCIEIGYGCPNSFDINVINADTDGINPESNLFILLSSIKETGRIIIQANDLIKDDRYDVNNVYDVERIIDEGVAYGKFSKDFMYISISIINKERIGNFIKELRIGTYEDEDKYLDEVDRSINNIINNDNTTTARIIQLSIILKMLELSNQDVNLSFNSIRDKVYKALEVSEKEINFLSKKCITENTWNFVNEINLLYPLRDIVKACYKLLVIAYSLNSRAISWKIITKATKTANDPNLAKIILLLLKELHLIRVGNFATDYIEVKIKCLPDNMNGSIYDRKGEDEKQDESVNRVSCMIIPQTPKEDTDYARAEHELIEFYNSKEKKSGAMCGLIELMNSLNKDKENNTHQPTISILKEELTKYYNSQTVVDDEVIERIQKMNCSDIAKQYIRIYSETDLTKSGLSILQMKYNYLMVAAETLAKTVGSGERNDDSQQYELDEQQIAIYNEHPAQNFNIRAGAGSGKTRLLAYWALKLIFEMHRNPGEILILTYNHSVRDELEERIISYSEKVGRTIIPNVYTFHEFAFANVKNLIEIHKNFQGWEEALLSDIIKNQGGLKYHYNYILIDEFQDITITRLEIINRLCASYNSSGQCANLFVVGDEWQSIYGYVKKNCVKDFLSSSELMTAIKNETEKKEKKKQKARNPLKCTIDRIISILVTKKDIKMSNLKKDINNLLSFDENKRLVQLNPKIRNGERKKLFDKIIDCVSIEPVDYYNKFQNEFKQFVLDNNYRSYSPIISLAKEYINPPYKDNTSKRSNVNKEECTYCIEQKPWKNIFESQGNNKSIFESKIDELIKRLTKEDQKRDFSQDPLEVGLLFRSNYEMFTAFEWIKNWARNHSEKYAMPIIQGSDIHYYRTREFFFMNRLLLDKSECIATEKLINEVTAKILSNDKVFDEGILDVAKSLALTIIKKNPGITCSKLAERFKYIAQREKDNLKNSFKFVSDGKVKLILSTIHKVKGMEYDVVVVPTSNYPTNLPNDYLNYDESNKEERRLMYVAYTRAKSFLFYQKGEREVCILSGKPFVGEVNKNYAKNGLNKVDISYGATESNYKIVNKNCMKCKQGTPLYLKKESKRKAEGQWEEWCLYASIEKENLLVGRLAKGNPIVRRYNDKNKEWEEIDNKREYFGLFVKSVNICDEPMDDNKEGEGVRVWSEDAKHRGYVYYIDYYGCISTTSKDED